MFELAKELQKQHGKVRLGIKLGKKEPDIWWLLTALATLSPRHRYFHPSYFPSPEERNKEAVETDLVDNNDAFFDNLPLICQR